MSSTDKQRDDLRTYILSTRDFWGRYRTLKENFLWIATTVYVSAVAAIDVFRLQPAYTVALLLRIVLAFVVGILWFFMMRFMQKLIDDRIYASDVISSCDALLALLLDPAYKLPPKISLTPTYQNAKNLREYIMNLVIKLGAPVWTFKGEPNQWNLKSPVGVVLVVTIASIILILVG